VIWVAESTLAEFTVIPEPEKPTTAPAAKLDPLSVTIWLAAPWPRLDGDADVSVGFAFTPKHPAHVVVP
jgi:hypothetical protein